MKKFLTLLALPLLFVACSTDISDSEVSAEDSVGKILNAEFSEDVRTYVEDGLCLRWHADDRITAFYGNALNREYRFLGKTGDNSGRFELVTDGMLGTGNILGKIYAVYPYNSSATITDSGVISYTLPAVQNYAENSFGRGANTMIAVTENVDDTYLAFKNACGCFKFKLYGNATIKSIEIKGNNNEKISGSATATIAFGEAPVLKMSNDATTTITLDCGEGITLGTTAEAATEFWFVVPETTFTKGITIVATDAEGNTVEKSTSNSIKVERNHIQPMQAFEFKVEVEEPEVTPITATLTYTECKSSIEGYGLPKSYTNSFGTWTICAYDNQNGIQINKGKVAYIGTPTFAGDITKITLEFAESYSGNIYLCSESGTTAVAGQFESFSCSGMSKEYTLTTTGVKSLFIRSSACARITKITIETSGGNGGGTTPEPEPEPEDPIEPEIPDYPIINDGIIGGWHIRSYCGGAANADIYMQLNSDKTFLLYQRTNSATFVKYEGTYSLDEANSVISGKYSDGVQWANSYKYSINDYNELVFVNTNNETEVTLYEPTKMPFASSNNPNFTVLPASASEQDSLIF